MKLSGGSGGSAAPSGVCSGHRHCGGKPGTPHAADRGASEVPGPRYCGASGEETIADHPVLIVLPDLASASWFGVCACCRALDACKAGVRPCIPDARWYLRLVRALFEQRTFVRYIRSSIPEVDDTIGAVERSPAPR